MVNHDPVAFWHNVAAHFSGPRTLGGLYIAAMLVRVAARGRLAFGQGLVAAAAARRAIGVMHFPVRLFIVGAAF
jgi:hypothetical protein